MYVYLIYIKDVGLPLIEFSCNGGVWKKTRNTKNKHGRVRVKETPKLIHDFHNLNGLVYMLVKIYYVR